MFFLPPSKKVEDNSNLMCIEQTPVPSPRPRHRAAAAAPPQLSPQRDPVFDEHFFFRGGKKTNIQFVSFLYGSFSKAITCSNLKQPHVAVSGWSASERGSLRRKDGWGQEKHLLRCLSEAQPEEMLVHILQQEKQLHLHVRARRTLCVALACFLQDVGKITTQDFSHRASVF